MSSVLGEGRWLLAVTLMSLGGCNGAPSRNILGSYFPSWMVCALLGIAVAGIARAIFKATGILQELPVPFVVFLAIGCAATFPCGYFGSADAMSEQVTTRGKIIATIAVVAALILTVAPYSRSIGAPEPTTHESLPMAPRWPRRSMGGS